MLNDLDRQPSEIYSVSQLNQEARMILEGTFSLLWIEGEISNLARPASGHIYFSLKDSTSQVRCAMFQQRCRQLTFKPENGMHVLLRAKVSLYEGRGDFQLIVETMEETGDGALRRAFEELKKRLAAAGLFDLQHKKALPFLPKRIGVITSPTGAAIRDIISVLKRRFACIPVIIYPTSVQGSGASGQIAKAIQIANQRNECDVLILARGGGSLEDLWPFNEENVAHAIFASQIPIISGIGHEIDFTIADFVADVRAPTPSAAAELVSPDHHKWQRELSHITHRAQQRMQHLLHHLQHQLMSLTKRLRHPGQLIQERAQQLDYIEQALQRSLVTMLSRKQSQLAELARTLDATSPLSTLKRGYAIVSEKNSGKIIYQAQQLKINDKVNVRLGEGMIDCLVENITLPTSPPPQGRSE